MYRSCDETSILSESIHPHVHSLATLISGPLSECAGLISEDGKHVYLSEN